MKSEFLKEYKGTIPDRCPETKQGEAAYILVKGLKLIVIAFTLYLCTDICCYALSDNEAAILIRAAFADPAWQSYLAGGVKRIINGLKCDPDLQIDMEQLIYPDYIRFTNVVWIFTCLLIPAMLRPADSYRNPRKISRILSCM